MEVGKSNEDGAMRVPRPCYQAVFVGDGECATLITYNKVNSEIGRVIQSVGKQFGMPDLVSADHSYWYRQGIGQEGQEHI